MFLASCGLSCGYHPVNQTKTTSCSIAHAIQVETASGYGDWSALLKTEVERAFGQDTLSRSQATLRVRLDPVEHGMSGFSSSGALTNTSIRLRVSVDLVQGTRMLWSAQSEPLAGFVQHTGNPRITVMNTKETIRRQLIDSIRELGLSYRQDCRLTAVTGEKP